MFLIQLLSEKNRNYQKFMALKQEFVQNKVESGEVTMPIVSKVVSTTTGDELYMLHQQGEDDATTIITL